MATTYLLRDIDQDVWSRLRDRAKMNQSTIKDTLLALVRAYADDQISVTYPSPAITASADATGVPN